MKLNFRLQNAPSPTSALPIILIHGLFGNLDNLGVLARDLQLAPNRVEKLVAIDIAPVNYQVRRHDTIFAALNAVSAAGVTQRNEAAQLMRTLIKEEGVIQFLLKSFQGGEWRFNVPALWDQYENIIGWQPIPPWPHPILFIRGELSPYIQDSYRDDIARQFPQARAHVVAGTGHWVHAEKPDSVLRAIHRFLDAA